MPVASDAALEVPPLPSAAPALAPVMKIACEERDPTPDAMPATPAPSAFIQLDAEIRRMQSRPGKYVYTGTIADVLGDGKGKKGAYAVDAEEAMAFGRRLESDVVDKSEPPDWAIVARTREAEMFERLRDGLATLSVHRGPGPVPTGHVALLTPQQLSLLARSNASGGSMNVAALEEAMLDFWNKKKQQELDGVDALILDRYARAADFAQTKNPAATRAVRRLAHYTSEIGNKRMAKLLQRDYAPDMYRHACAELSERTH